MHDPLGKNLDLRERYERNFHNLFEARGKQPMKRDRRGKKQGPSSEHACHAANGVAELELFRAKDGDGRFRKAALGEGFNQHARQVLNSERSDRLILESYERKDGKSVQRMAEMIEHVIPAAVDHTRFENRIIEARGAYDFLRRPLRLVVSRAAIWAGAQKAEQRELSHSRAPRGFDHVSRPFHVDALVRLHPDFAIDAGAMSHGSTSAECAD